MALITRISSNFTATDTSSAEPSITPTTDVAVNYVMTTADGTGADQADLIYTNKVTLSAASSTSIDLAGSLTDYYGATITFAKIKLIMVKNTSNALGTPTTSTISVGGAGATAFKNWITSTADDGSENVKVLVGGFLAIGSPAAAGYGVTAATADILKILNDSGASQAQYEIVIVGTSA